MSGTSDIFRVGAQAPDFKLRGIVSGGEGGTVGDYGLNELRGRWVVLFFYPKDFSIVCPTEVREFSDRFDEFEMVDAAVMGISTDTIESHIQWIKGLGALRYPLLADPAFIASRAYQTFLPDEGVSLRGTFIIDPAGILRYALYHDNAVGRSVSETLRVLAALRTGEMCPAEWQPGEPTLGLRGDLP
jgi:alkyl hydroperoxide reductase subunit AhpC